MKVKRKMKRRMRLSICLSVLLTLVLAACASASEVKLTPDDDMVNSLDALIILQAAAGLITL